MKTITLLLITISTYAQNGTVDKYGNITIYPERAKEMYYYVHNLENDLDNCEEKNALLTDLLLSTANTIKLANDRNVKLQPVLQDLNDEKHDNKPIGIGVFAGYDYRGKPTVAVGISYNFIRF